MILSTFSTLNLTTYSAEDDDSKLNVTKKVNWTPGSDTAQIEITTNVPDKNETQVLFIGTLCNAHSLEQATITNSINAIAHNADVRYFLFNKSSTKVAAADEGSVGRGDKITETFPVKTNNHQALAGYINTLYKELITDGNGFDSTKDTRVDYIVLEFDGSRLAAEFDTKNVSGVDWNKLAKELSKYYAAGKVIWITDGRVKNPSSTSPNYLETDGYTPTTIYMTSPKTSDGDTSYLSADNFRYLCALVAPDYFLAHTTADKTYYGNGKSTGVITLDDKYSLTRIERTLSGDPDESSYNDARQLTYSDSSILEKFLYMVIPGVTLNFQDQIEFSDGISVDAVEVFTATDSKITSGTDWTRRSTFDVTSVDEADLKTNDKGVKYAQNADTVTSISVTKGNADSTKNNLVDINATDVKNEIKNLKVIIYLSSTNKFIDCITLKTDKDGKPELDDKGNYQYVMNPNNGPVVVKAYSGGSTTSGTAIAEGNNVADAPAVNTRKITSKVTCGTKAQTGGDVKTAEAANNPYTIYSADYKTVKTTYTPNPGCVFKSIIIDNITYTPDNFKSANTINGTGYTVTLKTDGSLEVVFANLSADHAVEAEFENALTISKSADKTDAKAGDTITYTIKITNPTSSAVTGLKISDTLDSNLTYVSSSDSGSASSGVVTWSNITLAAGGSKTVTVTATVNSYLTAETEIKNVAVLKDSSDNEIIKSPENKVDADPREITVKYSYKGTEVPAGKTAPTSETKTYGTSYTAQTQTTATGWVFSGWCTDAACTKKFVDETALTKDNFAVLASANEITLYGEWTKVELSVSGTSYNGMYDGDTHGTAATASATLANGSTTTDGITIKYSIGDTDSWSETFPTIKDVGDITVKVKAEKEGYETATSQYTLKVTKRDVTLTSATDSK